MTDQPTILLKILNLILFSLVLYLESHNSCFLGKNIKQTNLNYSVTGDSNNLA